MKVRSRLLWLVFLAWLPSAVAIGIVARLAYVDQHNAALDDVQKVADSVGSIVEREVDKRFFMAKTLSFSNSLNAGDLERFYEEAKGATQGTDSWVMLLSAEQQMLDTYRPYDPQLSISISEGSPWLESGEDVYFSMKGPVLLKPVIGVAAAHGASRPGYSVVVAFDPAVLQSIVSNQVGPHGALVTVMDKHLRVLARSVNPSKWLGQEVTTPVRQRVLDGKWGFGQGFTLDNIPSLTYLSQPNRYGWYTIVAVPVAALNEQARKAALNAVGLAGGLLAVSLLCALYVARSIGRPILALQSAAEELTQEQVPAPMKTGLFETDQVAQALRDAGLRARESTEILEARVNDAVARTADVQAKLAESQKREAVGRLAGGIAHDFNNLLQTISAALHLLSATTPDGPPRRMLDSASRATGKATSLVKQMLAFGRAHTLEPEPVDLSDFVLKVGELSAKAAGVNVTLRAHIEPGLTAVFVDPTQLELALLNLIFNARDAMRESGQIEIRAALADARHAGLPESMHRHFVQLEVKDDGPGMDAATLQKAFDPYFTTKPVGAGSGLGLAQVLSFARQSGGDARILSEVGRGTTVQLFLPPTTHRPAHVPDVTTKPKAECRALRVLMVEDDPLVASVVIPAIEGAGHHVTHCQSGDEAKRILTENGLFDVVFSDVVMPGSTTGVDLEAWCRGVHPHIAVVLATGYSAQAPQSDVTVLRKPYHLDDLLIALQRAAAGQPAQAFTVDPKG